MHTFLKLLDLKDMQNEIFSLFSYLNSRFGRKRATQIPMVLMLIFTVVTGLSPNIYVYLASQFIVGVALGGFRINSIILGMRQYWCFQPLSGYLHWLTE